MFHRTIDDVAEALDGRKRNVRRCSVLIGAGCSRSAGIPVAAEIVEDIRRTYPAAYARAVTKDYPNCMAALDVGVRRDLIGRYVDRAKINWAHIALAQLIEAGYVDRVLTTNFDPLASRACALINVFPAVYDCATSHVFKPDQVSNQALFHLHGQRDGFVLLNTPTEVRQHRRHVKPVLQDAHSGRMWIVVGYSGSNDPVFDLLASTDKFEYGLYWAGRKSEPSKHVYEKLLTGAKGAYYVQGWDADDFFVLLAQKLRCFPPRFVRQPFTYLRSVLTGLCDYKAPHEEGRFDVSAIVRERLEVLIDSQEQSLSAEYHFLGGEYDRVVALLKERAIGRLSAHDKGILAWAYIMEGNRLHHAAKTEDSEKLYRAAIGKFRNATKVDPTIWEALSNWGNALFDLSIVKRFGAPEVMTRAGETLLRSAIAKYKFALAIDRTALDVHNNWANALADLARGGTPEEEVQLLKEALPHYRIAVRRSEIPGAVYCNWGKALHDLARRTRTKRIWAGALAKFDRAAAFNPESYSTFLSWGNALSDMARRAGSRKLFEDAFDKYRRAAEIRPNDTAVYWNWINEVDRLAGIENGAKKEALLRQAASLRRKMNRLRTAARAPGASTQQTMT